MSDRLSAVNQELRGKNRSVKALYVAAATAPAPFRYSPSHRDMQLTLSLTPSQGIPKTKRTETFSSISSWR